MAFQTNVINVDQEFDCLRECTYVEEADEINQLLQQTVNSKGLDAAQVYPRFRRIVSPCRSTQCSAALSGADIRLSTAAGKVSRAITAAGPPPRVHCDATISAVA